MNFKTLIGIVTFLFIDIILDIAQVFSLAFVFFSNLTGINLSSQIVSLTTFIIFICLRNLGLRLICISKRRIIKLSFVYILIVVLVLIFFS